MLLPTEPASGVSPRRLELAAVLLSALLVYSLSAARTVTGEDAGELLAGAAGPIGLTGWMSPPGIVHPPGYPLWTLLGWLAAHAGAADSIPFRVSLLSGLLGAMAAAVTAGLVLRLTGSVGGALLGGWLVAFSRDIHAQAVIPEVYTLHLLFVAVGLDLVVRWDRERRWRLLQGFLLCFGLALSSHPTSLPLFLAMSAWTLWRHPPLLRSRLLWIQGPGLVVLGLLPYLALWIFASLDPPMNWGNPSTAQALWDHVARRQQGGPGAMLAAERDLPETVLRSLIPLGRLLLQWPAPLLLLGVPGGIRLWRRDRPLLLLLGLLLILSTSFLAVLAHVPLEREGLAATTILYLPGYLVAAILLGLGLAALLEWVGPLVPFRLRSAFAPASAAVFAAALLVAGYPVNDRSRDRLMESYARALLEECPANALLFLEGDHSAFPVLYLQQIQGERTDVVLANPYGYLDPAVLVRFGVTEDRLPDRAVWEADPKALRDALLARQEGRPVLTSAPLDLSAFPGARLFQTGLLLRVLWPGEMPGVEPGKVAGRLRELAERVLERLPQGREDYSHDMVLVDLWTALARAELTLGRRIEGLAAVGRAEAAGREVKEVFNNLGALLLEMGLPTEGEARFRAALTLDPDYGMALRNQQRARAQAPLRAPSTGEEGFGAR